MKSAALSGLLAWIMVLPAHALSCRPADVVASYQAADDTEESFLLVNGRYVATGPRTARAEDDGTSFPARFDGHRAGSDGFATEWASDIVVEIRCHDPWCPVVPDDAEVLAFLRLGGPAPVMEIHMCPGWRTYLQPTAEQFRQAEACITGGPCERR